MGVSPPSSFAPKIYNILLNLRSKSLKWWIYCKKRKKVQGILAVFSSLLTHYCDKFTFQTAWGSSPICLAECQKFSNFLGLQHLQTLILCHFDIAYFCLLLYYPGNVVCKMFHVEHFCIIIKYSYWNITWFVIQ